MWILWLIACSDRAPVVADPAPALAEAACVPAPRAMVPAKAEVLWPAGEEAAVVGSLTADPGVPGRVWVAEPLVGRLAAVDCGEAGCVAGPTHDGLGQPVRVAWAQLEADAALTPVVADIGSLAPADVSSGRVLALGEGAPQVLLGGLPRTSCAVPIDVNGDGLDELLICGFGHTTGAVLLAERRAGAWAARPILPLAGAVGADVADVDGDGDLDAVVVVSQGTEAVYLLLNQDGLLVPKRITGEQPSYYGMSSVRFADVDGDGKPDILVTNGDTMDGDLPPGVNANGLHGLDLLRNQGGSFVLERLHSALGAYGTVVADLDGDCDLDIVLVTHQVPGRLTAVPVAPGYWLEAVGDGKYAPHVMPGAGQSVAVEVVPVGGRPAVLSATFYQAGPSLGSRLTLTRFGEAP